jgi:hypothetical protein
MLDFFVAVSNFITRQVGFRGDAASATGSLHSKIKDIKDSFKNVAVLSRTSVSKEQTTSWSETEVSESGPAYTGAGRIRGLKMSPGTSQDLYARIVLVVDGNTIMGMSSYGSSTSGIKYAGRDGKFDDDAVIEMDIPFRSSFSSTVYYKTASGYSSTKPTFTVEYDQY